MATPASRLATRRPGPRGLALTAVALGSIAGCGDPLVDGDDPGPPQLVLEGRIAGLDPNEGNQATSAALIWAPLPGVPDPPVFEREAVAFVPDEVGAFQLQVFEGPAIHGAAVAFLAVLEGGDGGA